MSDPKLTEEQLDAGLTIEQQLDERFDELFRKKWNARIRPWVEQMIHEKVSEEAIRLGKHFGHLLNGKDGML